MAFPRPLALGLMQLPALADRATRSRARIELALDVNDRGYALVETYELGAGPGRDDVVLAELEDAVLNLDVQLVALSGPVDERRIELLAEQRRILVWRVEHPTSATPPR